MEVRLRLTPASLQMTWHHDRRRAGTLAAADPSQNIAAPSGDCIEDTLRQHETQVRDKQLLAWPPPRWIIGHRDRMFEPLYEFEPGAIEATIILVREGEEAEVVDAIAWPKDTRSPWWMLRGIATVLGEHELSRAWWDGNAAQMVATPADFVACHGAAFCILDWSADLNSIIGRAPAVECATAGLAAKLRAALIEQALPKIPISIRHHRRAAA